MKFLQLLFITAYFGTPLVIIGWAIRLARSTPRRPAWPMLAALGLWVLQAAVLLHAILGCVGGHCRPTPLEEHGPVVLLAAAYLGIGAMFWISARRAEPSHGV